MYDSQRRAAKETQKLEKTFEEIIVDKKLPFVFDVDAQSLGAISSPDKEIYETLPLYTTVHALIQEKYVRDVSSQELLYAALKGMCRSLDDYGDFLTQEEYAALQKETKGEYGGIGLVIGMRNGMLTVIAPIEDSPAFKAGIKAGDIILKIDNVSVADISLYEAVKRVRGTPGTDVKLIIKRKGVRALIETGITREFVEIISVRSVRMLQGNIAFIRVIEFDTNAAGSLEKELKRAAAENARGLILDLRNNPGGLLSSGIEIAHYFLDKDELIVTARNRDGEEVLRVLANGQRVCPEIPIVVLLNQGSASASEIIAAAIRDHGHGMIVGERSYGKGSVQMVIPFKDNTAIRLTTALYYTPDGKSIDKQGIMPDVEVAHSFLDENLVVVDHTSEAYLLNDKQIVTALEKLKEMIQGEGSRKHAG